MARFPMLEQRVESEPLRAPQWSANATANDFGGKAAAQMGALGQGIGRVAQSAAALGDQLLAEKEDSQVRAALAEFRTKARDILQGDQGLLSRQGENTDGITKEAQKSFDALRNETGKRFVTPRAREAWNRVSDREVEDGIEQAARHQAIEMRRFHVQSLEAQAESAHQKTLDDPYNSDKRERARAEIEACFRQLYAGSGEAVVQNRLRQAFYRMDADVVDRFMADRREADALEYVKEHESEIDPTYLSRVKPALEGKLRKDALLARAIEIAMSEMPEDQKFALVHDEFKDAEDHAYVLSRVRELSDQARVQEQRIQKQKEDAALTEASQKWGSGDASYEFPTGFDYRIENAARLVRRQIFEKGEVVPDWDRYKMLLVEAQDNPDKFKKRNLNEERGNLNTSQLGVLTALSAERTSQSEWNAEIDRRINEAYANIPTKKIESHAKTATAKSNDQRMFRDKIRGAMLDKKVGDRAALQEAIDFELKEGMEDRPWYQGDRSSFRYQINEGFYVPEEENAGSLPGWLAPTGPPPWALSGGKPPWLQEPKASRPAGIPNTAELNASGTFWEVKAGSRVKMRWDLNGKPVNVRD
jgi:osmotically-inducible protein OsmY